MNFGSEDQAVTEISLHKQPARQLLPAGCQQFQTQTGDQLMIYEGKAITVKEIEGGIAQLNFDLQGESVNKFNRLTIEELGAAAEADRKSIRLNSSHVRISYAVFCLKKKNNKQQT